MRKVQIYVEGVQLDLFNDEQINVNSTIQNIADISKVYTDFSQSFTVPASVNNNKIFQHFYNSEVFEYNQVQFNVNVRKSASIEINLTPFRTGKIQLEKANLKNGKPESYTVTFYGELTSLKDLFGEEMLSDLDLDSLNHSYTGTQVYNRITDHATDYDVRYPLISSDRNWTNSGSGSDDITHTNGRIVYTELFPAIKVTKLFDAIVARYGVTFNSTFFGLEVFKKLFLWAKKSNANTFITQPLKVNTTSVTYQNGATVNPFDLSAGTLNFDYSNISGMMNPNYHSTYPNRNLSIIWNKIQVTISAISSATVTYYIDLYENGVLYNTTVGSGNTNQTYTVYYNFNDSLAHEFYVNVRATEAITFKIDIAYKQSFWWTESGGSPPMGTDYFQAIGLGATQNLTGITNLAALVPEMKVSDFFSGILKMFNLTLFGTEADTYQIETLETFYNTGDVYDITTYTDITSIDVDRVPLYKKISFKYQEGQSILNKQFDKLYLKQYGNISQEYNYDGGEFTVELPFENLMGEKFTGTDLQVAYALDENLAPYIPKPCLFYMYTNQTTSVKFYDGSSEQTITNYLPFGQDVQVNSVEDFSLNFNADISTFLLYPINNSLFATYYFNYLANLYRLQNRLTKVKTQLPISVLTDLQLNDRLVISDKRYIINEMRSNITTGEVNFTLLLDFRPVRPSIAVNTNSGANCVNVPINLLNGVVSATIATTTGGVTITPSTITSSQVIVVCVPVNPNPTTYLINEAATANINTEDYIQIVTEGSETQDILLTITHTYANGSVNDTSVLIQQP